MKKVFFFLLIISNLLIPSLTHAQQIGLPKQPQGRGVNINTGDAGSNLGTLLQNVITLFFAVGGIGFTIMIIWGAVNWILSGGDKEKIAGARKRITTAIVGLVVLSLTFVIMLVVGQILNINSLYSGQFRIPGLLQK